MKARVKCLYKTKCSKQESSTAYLDSELCNEEQAQMELHLEFAGHAVKNTIRSGRR